MKVMLTKDVENVGPAGNVKDVADGYGRNFLLRRKLAVPAGTGVETEAKRLKDAAVKRETKDRVEAQALADEIDNKTVVVRLKVGAEDKAFGSITNQDIAAHQDAGRARGLAQAAPRRGGPRQRDRHAGQIGVRSGDHDSSRPGEGAPP